MKIRTFSGKYIDLLRISSSNIDITDIARSLAQQCRYNGHIPEFYSVAEHSVLVSQVVPEKHALCGLLHDAPEAYVGDIVKPVRELMTYLLSCTPHASPFEGLHDKVWQAICTHYGLSTILPVEVERADVLLMQLEMLHFWGYKPVVINGMSPDVKLHCLSPKEAEKAFLERWEELRD